MYPQRVLFHTYYMKKLLSAGPLAIILAAFLWSLDGLLRRSLYVLPPIVIVFYEHLIGFALLLPFLIGHIRTLKTIKPKTWAAMGWVTILSSIIGTLCYTAALGQVQYIQFSVVVLLQQLQPLFVIGFAWLVLKEAPAKHFFVWVLVALAGAYLVSFPSLSVNLSSGSGTVIAALLAIGAAFSWGSSTAFSRYALLQMPSQLTTGLRFGMATIVSFLWIVLSGKSGTIFAINETQIGALVFIALTTGMVALSIYYYGLKRTPAWISAVCELAWPLSAVVIDYTVYHKSLTMTQWVGSGLLLASIYVATMQSRKHAQAELDN